MTLSSSAWGSPPFRVAGQHNSLRGAVEGGDDERPRRRAWPVELTLVERLGRRGHALRQQHGVARQHASPLRVRFGELHDRLAIIDAARYGFDAVGPVGAGGRESLVLAAGRVDLGGDVLPCDRGAVAPYRFRVDGPCDYLRVGACHFGAGEVVGVQGHRTVGGDPERPRHAGLEHARGVGRVAVDMQRVEVLRKRCQRQPQVATLLQGGDVLRIDVVSRPELRGSARRGGFLLAAGAGGESETCRQTHTEGNHGEASDLHGDRRYLRFGSG